MMVHILSFNQSSRDTSHTTTFSCCGDVRYLIVIYWNIRTSFYGYSLLIVAIRYVHVMKIVIATVIVTLIFDVIRYIS